MKPIGIRPTLLAALLFVAASGTGCNRQGADGSQSALAAKLAKPGPKESFELIIEDFKRRVEGTPVGFVVTNGNGRSTMTGTNTVSYELIPPANAADPYKALITVASQSRYSIKRTTKGADESERAREANKQSGNPLAEPGGESGVEILDPSLSSKPAAESKDTRPAAHANEEIIPFRPDTEVRKYELIYENGRWKLVTELNLKTEQSIQNAFDTVLSTQI